jgi:MFS family permease
MLQNSIKTLALACSIFFFTNNLSGVFLPIYFKESGLNLFDIIEILFFTFLMIGLLPLTLLKLVKNFEAVLVLGIFTTMLFNIVLIYVKTPIVLGLFYGLGIATFWPSFNLLQFRLSEMKSRARTVSLFSSIIPSVSGIVGPAAGSLIIANLGFTALFATSILLHLTAFVFSLRIGFVTETRKLGIPKDKVFRIFFVTFILWGMVESYWLAYPFFVFGVSGTVLNMGLVYAVSGLLISAMTFVVNWVSDIKRARVEFTIISAILYAAWYFAIANSSTMHQIVALSIISGLASAFALSWLAHYADVFPKEYYASILVLMEVGLMLGRLINLAPTYALISKNDYASYFVILGIASLLMIPFYIKTKKLVKAEN